MIVSANRTGSSWDARELAIRALQERDRMVRAHEQAHLAAAGDLAVGGPSYVYTVGPDGKRYAVGGEVEIAIPEGSTPEETLQLAAQALRAALAPANPSGPDRAAAAVAAQKMAQARVEIIRQRMAEQKAGTDGAQARVFSHAMSIYLMVQFPWLEPGLMFSTVA